MGIHPADFRLLIVRPTLQKLGQWTPSLENLLIGTAAQASGLGARLSSPAGHGVYQISEQLHQAVWDGFLAFHEDLASSVRGLASQHDFLSQPHDELIGNLRYATAIAWGVYARHGLTLPDDADLRTLAHCWHRYFCQDRTLSPRTFVTTYRQLVNLEKAKAA